MEWDFWIERKYVPFALSLNCFLNSATQLQKILPCNVGDGFLYHNEQCYFPKGDRESIAQEEWSKGFVFLRELGTRCEKDGEKLLQDLQSFLLIDDISEAFSRSVQAYISYVVYFSYVLCVEDLLAKELSSCVKKYTDEDILQSFLVSSKELAYVKELRSLCNISSALKKGKDVSELLQEHHKQFAWMQMRWFVDHPSTKEEILLRAKEIKNPENYLSEFIMKDETEDLFAQHVFEEHDKQIVYLVQQYIFLRTYRADVLLEACYFLYVLLQKISDKFAIAYDDLLYYSWQEVQELLEKNPLLIDVAARKQNWALKREKDTVTILFGKDAEELFTNEGIVDRSEQMTQLQGTIAFKGIVRGNAKIVESVADIVKVKTGDVLVAVMTFPNFLPAMEKAAAFVTNDGGILSHASIIAREMKKPCITGTKHATHVFSDGDLLEVDAEKGIVRKL